MVDLYLKIETQSYVRLLSIPQEDIKRLSLRPLKWLRFVVFAVCGSHGDISTTEDGPVVNYDTTFEELANSYYYISSVDHRFVDFNGANDRVTSSVRSPRRNDLCGDILVRDGNRCVVTQRGAMSCDTVHIIPHSKGDEYINKVTKDRSALYDPPPPQISRIDAPSNAMLLRKDLHSVFANGVFVFLKTPNFALNPSDIPILPNTPIPPTGTRISMQYLKKPDEQEDEPPRDAVFPTDSPPAILFDYMYGVAAYKHWGGGPAIRDVMDRYFSKEYKSIPIPPRSPLSTDGTEFDDSDDSRDGDYEPRTPPVRNTHRCSSMWDGMLQAMDEMNAHMMFLRGITPEVWAANQAKKEEEERDASRSKVLEWMNASDRVNKDHTAKFEFSAQSKV